MTLIYPLQYAKRLAAKQQLRIHFLYESLDRQCEYYIQEFSCHLDVKIPLGVILLRQGKWRG